MDAIYFLKSEEFLRIKKIMGISDEKTKQILRWKFLQTTPTLKLQNIKFFIKINYKFCIFVTKLNTATKRASINFTLRIVLCGKRILRASGLHVHHKNGRKNYCDESNLVVLCADCHQAKHNHKIKK